MCLFQPFSAGGTPEELASRLSLAGMARFLGRPAEEQFERSVHWCLPFADLPVDHLVEFQYLIVACRGSDGRLAQKGYRISKAFLKSLAAAPTGDKIPFSSEEITTRFMACFEQPAPIAPPVVSKYGEIGRIGELLWELSTTREHLIAEEDKEDLAERERTFKAEIRKRCAVFKAKIPAKVCQMLTSLCDEVFAGKKFGDEELGGFICYVVDLEQNS